MCSHAPSCCTHQAVPTAALPGSALPPAAGRWALHPTRRTTTFLSYLGPQPWCGARAGVGCPGCPPQRGPACAPGGARRPPFPSRGPAHPRVLQQPPALWEPGVPALLPQVGCSSLHRGRLSRLAEGTDMPQIITHVSVCSLPETCWRVFTHGLVLVYKNEIVPLC